MTRAALTPVLLIALTVSTADAQTCTGAASFRDHPMQVAGAMASVNRATDIGGTFLAGRRALFGGGGVAMSDPEFGSTMTNVIGVIGFEFTDADDPAFFCPIGQVRVGNGPDFASRDGSSFATQAGVSVGLRVWEARNATVIPTFSVSTVYERYTAEITGVQSSASIVVARSRCCFDRRRRDP